MKRRRDLSTTTDTETIMNKINVELNKRSDSVELSKNSERIIKAIVNKDGNCPCRVDPTPCPCVYLDHDLDKDGRCTCGLYEVKRVALYKKIKRLIDNGANDVNMLNDELNEIACEMTDTEKKSIGL